MKKNLTDENNISLKEHVTHSPHDLGTDLDDAGETEPGQEQNFIAGESASNEGCALVTFFNPLLLLRIEKSKRCCF